MAMGNPAGVLDGNMINGGLSGKPWFSLIKGRGFG
jgi:hypothetical protein